MKISKSLFAVLFAFIMLFSMTVPASAQDPYTLTIYNKTGGSPSEGIDGGVYKITQIKGEYNAESGEYEDASLAPIQFTLSSDFDFSSLPVTAGYIAKGSVGLVLPKGTYEIEEVTPAPGYDSFDVTAHGGETEDQKIIVELPRTEHKEGGDVVNHDDAEVTFKAQDTRIDAKVVKKDGDNQNANLAGATFQIQKKNEETQQYEPFDMDSTQDGVQSDVISAENTGEATFANIPAGEYKIVEIGVPEGYLLDKTEHTFEVVSDDKSDMPKFSFEHVNYKEPTIEKKVNDQLAEDPLFFERHEGFTYSIEIQVPNDIASYKEFVIVDANQNADVVEMTLPTDVKLDDVDVADKFTIESDGAGGVKLTGKVDDPAWADMTGGKLVIKIPAKFLSDATPLCVLTQEGTYESGCHKNTFKLDYKNQFDVTGEPESNETHVDPKNAKLIVKKTESDGTTLLAGAEFKLEPISGTAFADDNKEHNTRTDLVTTNDPDNLLTIDNLDAGVYKLTEVKSPEGYRLLDKPIEIELKYSEDAYEVQLEKLVKNFKKDEWMPNTGTSLALGFGLFGGAAVLASVIMKKKKEDK